MKKLLSLLLVLMMLLSSIPAFANDADWEYNYDYAYIEGYTGSDETVSVPLLLNEGRVRVITENVLQNNDTMKIFQGFGAQFLDEIRDANFYMNDALVSVTFPHNLKVLGERNFMDTDALLAVTIPENVCYIGAECFTWNDKMTSVTFEGDCPVFGPGCFENNDQAITIKVPDDQLEAYQAALPHMNVVPSGQNSLTKENVTNAANFTVDGNVIVSYNKWETRVDVPAEVNGTAITAIGDGAFPKSHYVSYVTLPEGVTSIGDASFAGMHRLRSIELPSTLKSIGANAFEGFKGHAIALPEGLETIGANAFLEAKLEGTLVLPSTVTSVGEGFLDGCKYLEKLVVEGDPSCLPENMLESYPDLEIVLGEDATDAEKQLLQARLYGAPEMTLNAQPTDVVAAEGEQVSISVDVTGDGLSYAWYVRNVKDKNFALDESQTGSAYTVTADASCDGRTVYCVITDMYGASVETDLAMITLGAALEITVQPADVELPEGDMTEITIEATGDGLSYQWYVMPVSEIDFSPAEGFTTNVYSVPVDADSDWSSVYCEITDAYGNQITSDTATIFMAAPEVIVPEGAVDPAMIGSWIATGAEVEGMVLDQAMLEQFGMNIRMDLNADGSAVIFMEGEEMGGITWMVAEGCLYLTAEGDTMPLPISEDGTLNFEGIILAKEDAEALVTEPEIIVTPAAPAEGGVVGVWNAVSAEADGMTLDKAMLEMFGLLIKLTLNADGSGSLEMEGEAGEIAWTETDGVVSISVEGDSMEMTLNADGTMSGDFGGVIIAFEKEGGDAPAVTEAETVETPAAPAEGGVVGVWNAVSAEADGMTLDKAMLEMFGMLIKLTLNADGSGSLEMEGEAGEIAWTETDGVVSISVEGDSMDMTLNADGTMSGDFGGAIIVFEKESGAAPAVTETEAVETPAASEGGFEGNWVNETGTLVLNADGTGSYTSNFSGNTTDKTWAAVDGGIEFSDMMWYGSKGVLQEDGTLNIDDGWHIFYREGSEPAAPADTDDGEEEMSDEEMLALLALLAEMEEEGDPAPFFGEWMGITAEAEGMTMNLADYGQSVKLTINEDGTALMDDGYEADETFWTMSGETMMVDEMIISLTDTGIMVEEEDMKMYFEPYTAEEIPAAPAEGDSDMAAYAGIWYMCYCCTGGMEGDLRPMGVNSTLVLREDGYASIDFPSPEEGEWYFDEGQARFGVNGMPLTLLDGGFLKFGSDLGGYVIFSQDAAADWEPAPSAPVAAPVMPVMPAATEAPKAAAPVAAADIDLQALMNRKFVAKNFTSYGQIMDASMLGAEYSLFFRENGTVDFGLAGMVVPNLTWGLGKVAIGLTEVDAFVINYYGTMFNAVLTETGFDMDYYGTMTLHFVPAE